MSSTYIPIPVRRRVAAFSRYRCAYCQTSQRIIGPLLEIDHIIPQAHGGTSDEENLIWACPMCNGHKSARVQAMDLQSGMMVPLFHPRLDEWIEHFEWVENGTVIRGKTPKGRATVIALNMNHPDVVGARELWVSAGWHPPTD
ncbi:MAG: HNH endonuclease [Ardenticatenaceae bacterium]